MNTRDEEPVTEINRHGISNAVRDDNFGLITIDWEAPNPVITLEIRDETGAPRIQHTTTLDTLREQGHAP
jgi:hypothetical protein